VYVRERTSIGRKTSIQRCQSGRKEGADMLCHRVVSHNVTEAQETAVMNSVHLPSLPPGADAGTFEPHCQEGARRRGAEDEKD